MPPDNSVIGYHRFGSEGLARLIREKREQLVVHIHGHSHDGAFIDHVRGGPPGTWVTPVINPGSLHHGEYGVLCLGKQEDGKWSV